MTILHRASLSECSWQELLQKAQAAGKGELQALIYSIRAAFWVSVQGDKLQFPPGCSAPREEEIFELRLFDGSQEWRWVRQGEKGRAAWIGEDPIPTGFNLVTDHLTGQEIECRDRWYLLAGWVQESGPTGVKMGEGRLGSYRIPPVQGAMKEKGIALQVREYLGRRDGHGNFGVLEERILGLSPAQHKQRA